MRFPILLGCALAFPAGSAFADAPVSVTPILSTQQTASGQPIVLPQGDVQVVVSRFVIQPGTVLPRHEHPFQRYGYVLSGKLDVRIPELERVVHYGPGDFIVETRGSWHEGQAVGTEPTVLIVVDQVEPGRNNTILEGSGDH